MGSRGPGHRTKKSGTEIVEANLEVVMGRDAHRATAELGWMPTPSPVPVLQPVSTESSPETKTMEITELDAPPPCSHTQ
jgi:hypothetical protein